MQVNNLKLIVQRMKTYRMEIKLKTSPKKLTRCIQSSLLQQKLSTLEKLIAKN